MRVLVLGTMVLMLAGCTDPYFYPAGGSKDCPTDPLEDLGTGFRVTVPEYVIEGDERTATKGWCVTVREQGGGGFEDISKVEDGNLAVLAGGPEGDFTISLYVPEPDDTYCSYALEAFDVHHPGTGFVDVTLTYEGVSACT